MIDGSLHHGVGNCPVGNILHGVRDTPLDVGCQIGSGFPDRHGGISLHQHIILCLYDLAAGFNSKHLVPDRDRVAQLQALQGSKGFIFFRLPQLNE